MSRGRFRTLTFECPEVGCRCVRLSACVRLRASVRVCVCVCVSVCVCGCVFACCFLWDVLGRTPRLGSVDCFCVTLSVERPLGVGGFALCASCGTCVCGRLGYHVAVRCRSPALWSSEDLHVLFGRCCVSCRPQCRSGARVCSACCCGFSGEKALTSGARGSSLSCVERCLACCASDSVNEINWGARWEPLLLYHSAARHQQPTFISHLLFSCCADQTLVQGLSGPAWSC